MRVLLEINGWQKEDDIDEYIARRGVVEVEFRPPVNWVVPPDRTFVPKFAGGPRVRLYHVGKHERGMPVFEFR